MTEQDTKRYERFLEDYETIINMDSASENLDGVAQVANFLKGKLEAIGLETEVTRQGERGVPCVKACTPSKMADTTSFSSATWTRFSPPVKRPSAPSASRMAEPGDLA